MAKHPLRLTGDQPADELFIWLKSNPTIYQELLGIGANEELDVFILKYPAFNFFQLSPLRDDNLAEAHAFFERHTEPILAVLGLYSLPYCYAGANGARVLVQSEKIVENPEKRLLETASFVFDVSQRNAFEAKGRGFVSILKVRLLHAAVRHYASRSITDEVPINQEDLLGTFLSFSLLVIRGVRKLGLTIDQNDADSYYFLWTKIGQLMGVSLENMPKTIKQAGLIERQIRKREFRASEDGKMLTKSLVAYFESQRDQFRGVDPKALMSLLLGEDISSFLGLPKTSMIKMEALNAAVKTQNFFKAFSETQFEDLLKTFEKNLIDENVQPDFAISFE